MPASVVAADRCRKCPPDRRDGPNGRPSPRPARAESHARGRALLPSAVTKLKVDFDATHWQFVATALEGTALEYKYVIKSDVGDAWAYVEKDASCGEIGNRLLTVSYGLTGNQAVNDTVLNWRNISPCGN